VVIEVLKVIGWLVLVFGITYLLSIIQKEVS
jgi:hypothetical protein